MQVDFFIGEAEVAVFRIIQEGLTNIHRHSGSRKARIQLGLEKNEMFLTIGDEGKGISTTETEEQKDGRKLGVGIAGMRERVVQLGGRFEIAAGNPGTIIKAVFPLRSTVD
jgi:signal transduction histidine kinase